MLGKGFGFQASLRERGKLVHEDSKSVLPLGSCEESPASARPAVALPS